MTGGGTQLSAHDPSAEFADVDDSAWPTCGAGRSSGTRPTRLG